MSFCFLILTLIALDLVGQAAGNDCTWEISGTNQTLDLSFASRAIMEAYSSEWLYQYSPCANRIGCEDGTHIENCMVTQMGDPDCVNCVSIWDDGEAQPTFNASSNEYQFVYSNGESKNGRCNPYVLHLSWKCDKEAGDYSISSVTESRSDQCDIFMQVGSNRIC